MKKFLAMLLVAIMLLGTVSALAEGIGMMTHSAYVYTQNNRYDKNNKLVKRWYTKYHNGMILKQNSLVWLTGLKDTKNGKSQVELDNGALQWIPTKYVTTKIDWDKVTTFGTIYGAGGSGMSQPGMFPEYKVTGYSKVRATGNVKMRYAVMNGKAVPAFLNSAKGCIAGTLKKGATLKFAGLAQYDSRWVEFYKCWYNGKLVWVSSGYSVLVK